MTLIPEAAREAQGRQARSDLFHRLTLRTRLQLLWKRREKKQTGLPVDLAGPQKTLTVAGGPVLGTRGGLGFTAVRGPSASNPPRPQLRPSPSPSPSSRECR